MSRNRERYNEYHRAYMRNRYITLMANLINKYGGKCTECGSSEFLQFHHRDRSNKEFDISSLTSHKWCDVESELDKCVLLCKKCHSDKHSVRNTHGTLSSYRYCRCELCKKAKSDYMKRYRETHTR